MGFGFEILLAVLGALAGLIGCAVVGVSIPLLILQLSGWIDLCKQFPVRKRFEGTWINFQSMELRAGTRFGNCVAIGLGNDGLSLKLWGVVFPFAPQAQIPWENVSSIETRNAPFTELLVITLSDGKTLSVNKHDALSSALSNKLTLLGLDSLYRKRISG